MSVEYLYYHACQHDIPPTPDDGATLKSIREAAEIDGQPVEADWPYLAMLPVYLANWIPPENVDVFSINLSTSLNSPNQIIRLLDADKPTLAVKTGHARYADLRRDTPYVVEIKIAAVKTHE